MKYTAVLFVFLILGFAILQANGYVTMPLEKKSGSFLSASNNANSVAMARSMAARQAAFSNVNLSGNLSASAFCLNINVGTPSQTFTVRVDTAFSNFVLLSQNCTTAVNVTTTPVRYPCNSNNTKVYNPDQSSTSSLRTCGGSLDCTSCESGTNTCFQNTKAGLVLKMYEDRVSFPGGLTAEVDVGAIYNDITEDFSPNSAYTGVLGMGYSAIGEALDAGNSSTVFFQLVKQEGINNIFSLGLKSEGGVLTLGGIDPAYYESTVNYTLDTGSDGYYEFGMGSTVIANNTVPFNYINTSFVLASAYPYILLPFDYYTAMISTFQIGCANGTNTYPGACVNESSGSNSTKFDPFGCFYLPDSIIAQYPNVTFKLPKIGGGTFDIILTPDDYFLYITIYQGGQPTICRGFGFLPDSSPGKTLRDVIMGELFMRDLYVVFDRGNEKIGFAYTNTSFTPISPTTGATSTTATSSTSTTNGGSTTAPAAVATSTTSTGTSATITTQGAITTATVGTSTAIPISTSSTASSTGTRTTSTTQFTTASSTTNSSASTVCLAFVLHCILLFVFLW